MADGTKNNSEMCELEYNALGEASGGSDVLNLKHDQLMKELPLKGMLMYGIPPEDGIKPMYGIMPKYGIPPRKDPVTIVTPVTPPALCKYGVPAKPSELKPVDPTKNLGTDTENK